MWRDITGALTVVAVLFGLLFAAYERGYSDAQSAFQREVAQTTSDVKNALRSTSHALSDASSTVEDGDALDKAALKEIEDEKASGGCRIDADSLRILDKIKP